MKLRLLLLPFFACIVLYSPPNSGKAIEPPASLRVVDWSPDGSKIAGGYSDGSIVIWDATTRSELLELDHYDVIRAIAWSYDSQRLATASRSPDIYVWDVATGVKFTLPEPYEIGALAWSHDDSRLAVARFEGQLRIWNMLDYTLEHEFDTGGTYNINWSLDDTWTVGLNPGGSIVLDAEIGSRLAVLGDEPDIAVASTQDLSADGKTLVFAAITNGDPTLQPKLWFWDISTYEYLFNLEGHSGLIQSVKWNPVHDMVASGGDDGTIRLWNVENRQMLSVIDANVGIVYSLDWSPDGTQLAYGGVDGTLRIEVNPVPASPR